jgi:serine/threonine protein kinase
VESNSPAISHGSSPTNSNSYSPESISRSNTPIAPQPLRPFIANAELVPSRDEFIFPSPFAQLPAPVAPTPNAYGVSTEGDTLAPQFITLELIQQQLRRISSLVLRQGWQSPMMVYQWVIKNPRTALMLWMAEDLQAWPKASFMGLEDSMLPYSENDLERIATEPTRIFDLQWKVAIKQLPREGRHTEFATSETVPLATATGHRPEHWMTSPDGTEPKRATSKRIDCVTFCDGSTDAVFVRKRLDVKAKPEKEAILSQIRDYNTRLSQHANIARIVASYARGQTVAFLTLKAETNLGDYLELFSGASEASTLLGWTLDLASAVKYIHDRHVQHRSIRPQKILVDPHTRRVRLSVFGIAPPARSAGALLFPPYSTDPAYIYAAPETVKSRDQSTAADVFSLGCVFLEMATAAKGLTVEELREYRSATSHDASYHQNLGRVDSWLEVLRASRTRRERANRAAGGPGVDVMMPAGGVQNVLTVVHGMVSADPHARPSMKRVLSHLEQGRGGGANAGVTVNPGQSAAAARSIRARRRSFDVSMELARAPVPTFVKEQGGIWGELESLDGYYSRPVVPKRNTGDFVEETRKVESPKREQQTFYDEAWH